MSKTVLFCTIIAMVALVGVAGAYRYFMRTDVVQVQTHPARPSEREAAPRRQIPHQKNFDDRLRPGFD